MYLRAKKIKVDIFTQPPLSPPSRRKLLIPPRHRPFEDLLPAERGGLCVVVTHAYDIIEVA